METLKRWFFVIIGRDPAGSARPPRTGSDRSARIQFVILFVFTLAMMGLGLVAATYGLGPLTPGDVDVVTPVPSGVVSPTATPGP